MEADWCNGNWWMQLKCLPFFSPQFLKAILYKLMALSNSTSVEFNGKIPHGITMTMDTDSTYAGLWKLHPNVSSTTCSGSQSRNFHIQWLGYMEFYAQAITRFTLATSIGQEIPGKTRLIQVAAQINAGSRLASIHTDCISNGPSVHND